MSNAVRYEADLTCAECGCFGAYAFCDEALCTECYQQRGSCCAERQLDDTCDRAVASPRGEVTCAPAPEAGGAHSTGTLRLNPNCCYKACPRCSAMRRLRDFQAHHPNDWRSRLRGLPRLVAAAQERE